MYVASNGQITCSHVLEILLRMVQGCCLLASEFLSLATHTSFGTKRTKACHTDWKTQHFRTQMIHSNGMSLIYIIKKTHFRTPVFFSRSPPFVSHLDWINHRRINGCVKITAHLRILRIMLPIIHRTANVYSNLYSLALSSDGQIMPVSQGAQAVNPQMTTIMHMTFDHFYMTYGLDIKDNSFLM